MLLVQAKDEQQKLDAARWVLKPASDALIELKLLEMQAMKGRQYAEVVEKQYGQIFGDTTFIEEAITRLLKAQRITEAELVEWYDLALRTEFTGDKFQPLPSFTACTKLVEQAQQNVRRLHTAAEELLEPQLPTEIKQIVSQTKVKSLPELFEELKKKLGDEES
ncbi:hypothetical protein [Prosthecochloris sp.]|uniref:hypothetical protein n=1 Tax=Prosthecochloris sp. TaxID=290513 RepID=UPI0025E14DBA|nr:hypothetical protein [Prosthecochloris sp.]